MKRIVVLDTWISNLNLGNRVIMDAVARGLRELFPHDIVYHLPAVETLDTFGSRDIMQSADIVFYAGTNALRADMNNKWNEWGVRLRDRFVKNVVLFGVGWWQYQAQMPNLYTRRLLKQILHPRFMHAVRDSYTVQRMQAMGFEAINTGCPTIWGLTHDHCARIPAARSKHAVITLTEWKRDPAADQLLFQIVRRNYERVSFWPQQFEDYAYAREVFDGPYEMVDPSLEAYDEMLREQEVDYVGNRLHGGIRALQHGRRSIIITVDNRAVEMGRDFKLPVCLRSETASHLEEMICGSWQTAVTPDEKAITAWKSQFADFSGSIR